MSDWQPIETAPRDCGEIILGEKGVSGAGFWSTIGGWRSEPGWFWEMDRGNERGAKNARPTHWMPLPAPPEPNP